MKKDLGFTLVELMVGVAIAAILLAVAIPSFQSVIRNSQRDTVSENFFTALYQARSEAITRNTTVSICRSEDASTCATDGSDWAAGWIMYINSNTADLERQATEELLYSYPAVPSQFDFTSDDFEGLIHFNRSGRVTGQGSFELCNGEVEMDGKLIRISFNGRPQVEEKTDCP